MKYLVIQCDKLNEVNTSILQYFENFQFNAHNSKELAVVLATSIVHVEFRCNGNDWKKWKLNSVYFGMIKNLFSIFWWNCVSSDEFIFVIYLIIWVDYGQFSLLWVSSFIFRFSFWCKLSFLNKKPKITIAKTNSKYMNNHHFVIFLL